jgi:hypothetical protein
MKVPSMTTKSSYSMGDEFETLDAETQSAVTRLVEKVRRTSFAESERFRMGDIYAYPHAGGGVSWGVNGAPNNFCVARGISKAKTN